MNGKERNDAQRRRRISKSMSLILRHKAREWKIPIDEEGYVHLSDLLRHQSFRNLKPAVGADEVLEIVDSCEKQRFSIRHDGDENQNDISNLSIRANQGHSMELGAFHLTPLSREEMIADPVCVHGTNRRAWQQISQTGLHRMTRTHIHCARGLPGESGVISGMRSNCTVLVYVSLSLCLAQNIPFFISDNHVLLSPGDETGHIPPSCFLKVIDRKTGEELLKDRSEEVRENREKLQKLQKNE